MTPTSYILVVRCGDVRIRLKSLGEILLNDGYYVYLGSADIRRPYSRVLRHLARVRKKIRWHVDHLTTACTALAGIICRGLDENTLYRILSGREEITPLARGFGSSDYREHYSHLFKVETSSGGDHGILEFLRVTTLSSCEDVELVFK